MTQRMEELVITDIIGKYGWVDHTYPTSISHAGGRFRVYTCGCEVGLAYEQWSFCLRHWGMLDGFRMKEEE